MTATITVSRPPAPWIHARQYPWWAAKPQTIYPTCTLVF